MSSPIYRDLLRFGLPALTLSVLAFGPLAGLAAPAESPPAKKAAPAKAAPAKITTATKSAAQAPVKGTDIPIPDFSSENVAWIAINSDFTPVPGGPKPVGFDPKHPFVRNDQPGQATYRVADLDNANLKPWVKESLARANAG